MRPPDTDMLVMMGVSGCGKSSVGERVATCLGWRFLEGDSLHSPANKAKMQAGHPLDDADRMPWLDAIGHWMDTQRDADRRGVVACSALKRRYRERLSRNRPGTCFVWLHVDLVVLERRLQNRQGHFMPASLLASQLAALEPPGADEPVLRVDADGDIDATVQAVLKQCRRLRRAATRCHRPGGTKAD